MTTALIKIASAPTIESLTKLINEYYYSTTYRIEEGKVYNSKGLFEKGVVTKKGKRFIYSVTN